MMSNSIQELPLHFGFETEVVELTKYAAPLESREETQLKWSDLMPCDVKQSIIHGEEHLQTVLKHSPSRNVTRVFNCKLDSKEQRTSTCLERCPQTLQEFLEENMDKDGHTKLSCDERLHIIQQILVGVKHLNRLQFTGMHLIPANIFHRDGVFKIGNHTTSNYAQRESNNQNRYETDTYFKAPEVLNRLSETDKAEIFSMGLLAHLIMFGELPYDQTLSVSDTLEVIETITWESIKKLVDREGISAKFGKVIFKMLKGEPEERMNWEDIYKHFEVKDDENNDEIDNFMKEHLLRLCFVELSASSLQNYLETSLEASAELHESIGKLVDVSEAFRQKYIQQLSNTIAKKFPDTCKFHLETLMTISKVTAPVTPAGMIMPRIEVLAQDLLNLLSKITGILSKTGETSNEFFRNCVYYCTYCAELLEGKTQISTEEAAKAVWVTNYPYDQGLTCRGEDLVEEFRRNSKYILNDSLSQLVNSCF